MLIITQTALELGFLYALVAMALFLSYRILDIADLTTDGCFVLGAAVSVTVTAAPSSAHTVRYAQSVTPAIGARIVWPVSSNSPSFIVFSLKFCKLRIL